MKAIHSMNTKQVEAMSREILASVAAEINAIQDARLTMGHDATLTGDDVANALEAALLLRFQPAGGMLFLWWDAKEGLRMNPAPLPVDSDAVSNETNAPSGMEVE